MASSKEYAYEKAFMLATEPTCGYRPLFPVIVMPKYNGVRAMWYPGRGFYSRRGVRFNDALLGHIVPTGDVRLDGELYSHGMSLQDITSACTPNKHTASADTLRLKFHVYDALIGDRFASSRMAWLAANLAGDGVVMAEWRVVSNEAAIKQLWDQWVMGDKFEGLMLKNPTSHYIGGRSPALMKFKLWQDAEFPIVGINGGQGKYEGSLGAIECRALNGSSFTVGSGFSDQLRRDIWASGLVNYVGMQAKVQYQSLSADGIPIHPTFLAFV